MKTWIINLPAYARDCQLIVARWYDGEYWFYGGYDSTADAIHIANMFGNARTFKPTEVYGEWYTKEED